MNEIFNTLIKLVDSIHESFSDVSVTFKKTRDQFPLALFTRILCGCDSAIALIKSDLYTYIPVILRSVYEARIDLINVIKEEKYFDLLLYQFAEQEYKLLSEGKKYDDLKEYFGDGSTAQKRLERAIKLKDKFKHLKSEASVASRFNSAGLIRDYYTIYNDFCRDSHNNLDKIVAGHIDESRVEAVVHKKCSTTNQILYFDFIGGVCLHSANEMISYYGLSEEVDITNSDKYYSELQSGLAQFIPNSDE